MARTAYFNFLAGVLGKYQSSTTLIWATSMSILFPIRAHSLSEQWASCYKKWPRRCEGLPADLSKSIPSYQMTLMKLTSISWLLFNERRRSFWIACGLWTPSSEACCAWGIHCIAQWKNRAYCSSRNVYQCIRCAIHLWRRNSPARI